MSRLAYLRRWRARLLFWGGALAIGAVAAGFAEVTDWAIQMHEHFAARWPWLAVAAMPFGLVALTEITRRFAPASRGSGIPQAIAALDITEPGERAKLLSIPIALAKGVLTTAALMLGASVGREGPTVHIGASLMNALGRWIGVPYQSVQRSLILAGSAAGISAAFNTPIAGIVFAVEEMARSFEERATGLVLTAVVLAGVVSIGMLGNYTYFGHPHIELSGPRSWSAVLVCGLVAGTAGGLFSRGLLFGAQRMAPSMAMRPVMTVFALGLLIAMLSLWSGGAVYGSGYAEARALLDGGETAAPAYPLLKLLATQATYLTGIPGGVFSPSLSTGVGLGADLAPLFPSLPATAIMVLGMVAYFAGVTQAPMTGAIIVMEMIDGHELILPILATAFIATLVSKLVCPKPLYLSLSLPFRTPPKADD